MNVSQAWAMLYNLDAEDNLYPLVVSRGPKFIGEISRPYIYGENLMGVSHNGDDRVLPSQFMRELQDQMDIEDVELRICDGDDMSTTFPVLNILPGYGCIRFII